MKGPPPDLATIADRRAQVEARHAAGASGPEVCRAYADLMDELVAGLQAKPAMPDSPEGGSGFAQRNPESLQAKPAMADSPDGGSAVAILATGGYGRRELSPKSDVDLLFIPAAGPETAVKPAVDAVLHGLWDRRFQVGFATRTVPECVELAESDLVTATALMTARPLAGPGEPAHRLRAALWEHFRGARGERFLDELAEGMANRHKRYGGSVYLLEPNLKQGPGGLRDLHVALWAATLRFRIEHFGELLPRGVSSPREAKELLAARAFLLRLRNALHLSAGHATDRLTFEHQEAAAAAFGFGADKDGVERFMATYYGHATAAQKWSRLVLERCRERGRLPRRAAVRRLADAGPFHLFNGQLTVDDPHVFERDPRQIMRLFAAARREGVPVYGYAKERVLEAVPGLSGVAAEAWRAEPQVVQAFKEVLSEPDDPFDALGDLHETGVLGLMLPEFGAVTHRTHHDMYHVYTVDIHTLHAVRKLKALHRGELAESDPLLHGAMQAVKTPFTLYLGLLMHDAGKALGRGHAVKGARLLPAIGRRLGLTLAEAREAEWLVRDHLVMAHLSQRRDLSDPGLIRQFARQVGSPEALAKLFILTWADALTTGPQAYTDWKAALLGELYVKALERMRRGLDLYEDPARRVARLRRAVSGWLERHERVELADVNGEVDRFFASLPTAYFEKTPARNVARHLELLRRLGPGVRVACDAVARPRRGFTTVHLAAADRPGLLAIFAGALAAHRFDILGAEVHVTAEGKALDLFRVRDPNGGVPADDDPRWAALQADLTRVLAGDETVEGLLQARRRPGGFAWPSGPPVETSASLDQGASEVCSVIDVRAPDRVGLLYTITHALSEQGVGIVLARVTTEGDAAHDTFYVCDASGRKLDDARGAAVVAGLLAELRAHGP